MTDTSSTEQPRRQKGRNRPVVKFHRMRWAHDYLLDKPADGVSWPTPTFPIDVRENVTALGMQGNDEWGNCVDAGDVHLEMVTSVAAGQSPPFNPQPDNGDGCLAVTRYKAQTGATTPPGPGTDMASFMAWGLKQGFWKAWAPVDQTNKALMQYLMSQGFGILIGVDLTDNNEGQTNANQPWTGAGGPNPQNGHCVLWGYSETATGPHEVATWGLWQPTDDTFIEDCLVRCADGEAFLVVTTEEQLAKFDPQLVADCAELNGTVPAPPVTPPAPPTPPPAPPTPPPAPPTPPPVPVNPPGPDAWAELKAWVEKHAAWVAQFEQWATDYFEGEDL